MICNRCHKQEDCDEECFYGTVNKKAIGFAFKVTCNRCGGSNITIEKDTDYSFDGESEVLIDTGDLYLYCHDCYNHDFVSPESITSDNKDEKGKENTDENTAQ